MRVPHPSLISFEYVVENIPIDEDFSNSPHYIEHPSAHGILPPALNNGNAAVGALPPPPPNNPAATAAVIRAVPPQYQLLRQALPPDALFYQR